MLHPVIQLDEVDSTNSYALERLRDLKDGDVIQARIQLAGRGRWQRSWISHVPGNLCLSIVIKPAGGALGRLPVLAHFLAVCVCRVLERHGVPGAIKWPNDVLVKGRKIAGILAESRAEGGQFLGMVLGIGVNLNLDCAILATIEQPATALNLELGRDIDSAGLRDDLLGCFFTEYPVFMCHGFAAFREEYLNRSSILGTHVNVRSSLRTVCGRVEDIDEEGRLMLALPSGAVERIEVGEIFGGSSTGA